MSPFLFFSAMANGGGGRGKPPSFRTAAAAASIAQRQQQLQLQQAQMFQAPPGFALVQLQPPPPPAMVAADATVSRPRKQFLCRWQSCAAARSGRPTFGEQHYCFSCCRPKGLAMSPPADKAIATPQQQQQQQQQAKPRGSGGVSVLKTVPGAEPQPQTPAQKRAAKRARQRLARAGKQEPAQAAAAGLESTE